MTEAPMLEAPEPAAACRDAILEWGRLAQLADFAERRHGYGNSNSGSGITYPGDLDEYDIHVRGIHIPPGSLLVYGLAFAIPPGWERLVEERVYLQVLAEVLEEQGLDAERRRVVALLNGPSD
ncbi:hypothetical protein ACQ86G_19250 [Roseateles chitinivorans]|uniref:hypothetical protein n=1 Tax=Roseateles chitinivorans TaxID=2917965 RepID=UPI003D66F623